MDSYKRRKNAYHYGNTSYKKKRDFILEPGLKGFMCTCNYREKDCIKESYNILNEYADILYSEEAPSKDAVSKSSKDGSQAEGEEEEEEDIDTALAKEVDSLKKENQKKSGFHRFKVVDAGTNNCIFIRTTLSDPVELVHYIMKDVDSTKKQKTRYLLRMIPIETTCKAYMDDLKKAAGELFDKYFSKDGKTFAILFNRRNSNALDRNTVIEELAEMIKFRNVDNCADLKHAQLTVVVEVIQSLCCISVIPDYFKLHKYNLLEMCCPTDKGAAGDSKEKAKNPDAVQKDDTSTAKVPVECDTNQEKETSKAEEQSLSDGAQDKDTKMSLEPDVKQEEDDAKLTNKLPSKAETDAKKNSPEQKENTVSKNNSEEKIEDKPPGSDT